MSKAKAKAKAKPNAKITTEILFEEAAEEARASILKKHKCNIKELMKKRSAAQLIVHNIEREIEDLKLEISNELDA